MSQYVARTIKDRMKAIGMNQAWLAEKVGVSIAAVSKWTTDGESRATTCRESQRR